MANRRVVDIDQLAKQAADAQAEFQNFTSELIESGRKLTAAQSLTTQAQTAHRQLWESWIAARKSLEEKMRAFHTASLKQAGIPEDHPLWAWVRKS